MKKTILFLDVDGVFSVYQKHKERSSIFAPFKVSAWPIPMAKQLVRAIADDRRIHPVWLTCWDRGAVIWNEWALTRHFPVGYHLTSRQENYALCLFPEYADQRIDGKLIAARYYLRKFPGHKAVWIEDGFADETVQWAQQEGNVLIDTTEEAVLAMLVKEYDDLDKAARDFVDGVVLASRTVLA